MSAAPATALPRLSTRPDVERLLVTLAETMDALIHMMEAETRLVRAGRLMEAGRLQADKAELARRYLLAVETVKANRAVVDAYGKPELERLRQRHDAFTGEVRINMTVLATAKAVTEGLVQEIAALETKAAAPQGYSAAGGELRPKTGVSRPIGVNRAL